MKLIIWPCFGCLPHWRLTAHSTWGEGLRVKPTAGVRSSSSSVTPGGGVKRKCWRRDAKKRKSSIFARLSPRHTLRPARATSSRSHACSSVNEFLPMRNKRLIESCYTCRKGHEGVSLGEFTLLIQEVGRVESVWALPFVLIMQDRGKKRKHSGSLEWRENSV